MIRIYILTALRALKKNSGHTFINVAGLALGITCSIVIFLIVRFELSYDNDQPEGDRIYRVVTAFTRTSEYGYNSGTTYPIADALRQDFPDLEHVALVDRNLSDPVISVTKDDGSVVRFKEKNVAFADPEYFKMFHYRWLEGSDNALMNEKTVVLTASLAKKYFGNESALNKVINFNSDFEATVTGVISDPPLNTDFPFSMIFSLRLGADKRGWDDWSASSTSINCYVKLNPQSSKEDFDKKLGGWHLQYFTGENAEDGKYRKYFLQPLSEIHFDTRFMNFNHRVVSLVTLWSLSLIGVLLLFTACVNFINLNTVLIVKRSKEAGVRKVLGSSAYQLVNQFIGETFLTTLFALLVSAGLAEILLMNIDTLIGYRLSFVELFDAATMTYLGVVLILVTFLSGLYPAIRLSRFQPLKTLKGTFTSNYGEGLMVRRGLIVFQLVVSQALVITTIIALQQINHFMSQPIGLNSEAVVEFELPEIEEDKINLIHTLKERLQTIPGVQYVSMSNTGATSGNRWAGDGKAIVNGEETEINMDVKYADEDYLHAYQIELLSGENLVHSDSATKFLVNESFVRALGFENLQDALGTPVEIWGSKAFVAGVIKDFNASPLHHKISPVIIMAGTEAYYNGAVRLETKEVKKTLDEIKKTWESVYPNHVFEYSFLDETIAHFYDAERRNSYIMGFFAVIAILIGCIGLFGLVSFMAQQKTKEIGIRKTFGATVLQIVSLLSREFVVLIGVAFLVAAPIAYYFMSKWLSNFAYKISLSVWEFSAGLLVTLVICALTVGYRSVRAAMANPSDALRNE